LVRLDTMVQAARDMSSSSWARLSARRPAAGVEAEGAKSISTRFSLPSKMGLGRTIEGRRSAMLCRLTVYALPGVLLLLRSLLPLL
jgi:hypothetical protein